MRLKLRGPGASSSPSLPVLGQGCRFSVRLVQPHPRGHEQEHGRMQKVTLAIKQQTLLVHLDSYFAISGSRHFGDRLHLSAHQRNTCRRHLRASMCNCLAMQRTRQTDRHCRNPYTHNLRHHSPAQNSTNLRICPNGPGWARLGPFGPNCQSSPFKSSPSSAL